MMKFRKPSRRPTACLLSIILPLAIASCASSRAGLPPGLVGVDVPPPLQSHVQKLEKGGERNWVLHLNELALDAMRRGDRDLAKRSLDEAILYINDVFGSSAEARRARSLFFSEKTKLFKGDPYERSMTFFYRGVLYMQDKDWDNARASFRSAIFQDTFTEEEQNANDWVIFDYLIAVCETQLGREFYAEEAYGRAVKNHDGFTTGYMQVARSGMPPASDTFRVPNPDDTLLVIVQSGRAPQKVPGGEHGELLAYRRGMTGRPWSKIEYCGEQAVPFYTDSVYYQAATRGGRYFDAIQGRKVFFKGASRDIGQVGLLGGLLLAMAANSEGQQNAGLAVLAGGLALAVFSEFVQTKPDLRQWTTLPDALAVHLSGECSGPQQLSVFFSGTQAATATIEVPEPGEGLAVVLAFPPPQQALLLPPD